MKLVTVKTNDGLVLDAAWYPNRESTVGAILIHGKAQNFYTSVVRWLAPYLSEMGFSSLAINLRDHDHAEIDGIPWAVNDIAAGVKYLKEQGIQKFLLIGVSYGSNKAVLYLPEEGDQNNLLGVALLSTGGIKTYIPDLWAEVTEKLTHSPFPLLVIQAGADEFVPQPKEAGEELVHASANSTTAHLVVIDGANHGFSNHQEEVYKAINDWLIKNNWIND